MYAVVPAAPLTYILHDLNAGIINDGFYCEEFSNSCAGEIYLVEKVLRKTRNTFFVKRLGFDKILNSRFDKEKLVV